MLRNYVFTLCVLALLVIGNAVTARAARSQRRAAAVKKALVDRYHADLNRLSTSGDGDSVPIDTNDTLEGRARKRRVELTLD